MPCLISCVKLEAKGNHGLSRTSKRRHLRPPPANQASQLYSIDVLAEAFPTVEVRNVCRCAFLTCCTSIFEQVRTVCSCPATAVIPASSSNKNTCSTSLTRAPCYAGRRDCDPRWSPVQRHEQPIIPARLLSIRRWSYRQHYKAAAAAAAGYTTHRSARYFSVYEGSW